MSARRWVWLDAAVCVVKGVVGYRHHRGQRD